MELSWSALPSWAKALTAVAGALTVLWQVVAWGIRVGEAADVVPRIERAVDKAAIERALIYCEVKQIPPADCEMPGDDG